MFIQTQPTPNPATLKFLPGQDVAPSVFEFRSREQSGNSPLAQRLFGIAGVENVMLGRDFVSVSKANDTDWSMLKPMILAALMEHFSTGHPVILNAGTSENAGDDDPIIVQIKELIETRVRPAVMMDGGDIVFDSFDGGVVYLRLRGACAGCPSSTMTLKSGIENMLRHYVPEVTEVRQVAD
ncbi:MAG: NifU family protein [Alphaproteobacteria bacterium PRO2]|nr:NifU family protein [Alphaproteobacteria bacterium PRO2]